MDQNFWTGLGIGIIQQIAAIIIVGLPSFAIYRWAKRRYPNQKGTTAAEILFGQHDENRVQALKQGEEKLREFLQTAERIGMLALFPSLVESLFRFAVASTIGTFSLILTLLLISIQLDPIVESGIKVVSILLVVLSGFFFFRAVLEMWEAKTHIERKKLSDQQNEADRRNNNTAKGTVSRNP